MEYLLSVWPQILEQTQKAKHILLMADFDGTLAPIVDKPELASLPKETRQLLLDLANQQNLTVGIISGRSLIDLKEKINLNGIVYAGNHGLEVEGQGLNYTNSVAEETKPLFRIIHQILTKTLKPIKGVLIEDKGFSLSVHYRLVENDRAKDIEKMIEQAISCAATRGIFKVTRGKKVFEIRPATDWNKGKAIQFLMKKIGKKGRRSGLLPIYLGDDLTDEDGFETIAKYGQGISVYIGEYQNKSSARFFLKSPDEVSQFLRNLLTYAERGLLCEPYSTI